MKKLDRNLLTEKVHNTTGVDKKTVLKVLDASNEEIKDWLIHNREPVEFRGIMTIRSTVNPKRSGILYGKPAEFKESIGIVVKKSKKLIEKFRIREKDGLNKLKNMFD